MKLYVKLSKLVIKKEKKKVPSDNFFLFILSEQLVFFCDAMKISNKNEADLIFACQFQAI